MIQRKIASIIAFIVFATFFILMHDFETHYIVDLYLVIAVISTAIYFFYVNSAVDEKWTNEAKGFIKYLDGFLKIVQHLCLYCIWFSLRFGLMYFTYLTTVIFITFLIYNISHYKTVFKDIQGISIFIFDTMGLIIAIFLIISVGKVPKEGDVCIDRIPDIANAVGVSSALIITSILGLIFAVIVFEHNPFKEKQKVATAESEAKFINY